MSMQAWASEEVKVLRTACLVLAMSLQAWACKEEVKEEPCDAKDGEFLTRS